MSKRFLGIGECMVELFPESPGLWRQGFAGDVLNTLWYARACLDNGNAVDFHTGLGQDALSHELETFLHEHGIDLGSSPRFTERTLGLYTIHLDDGERSFSYWRETSAARWLARDREGLAHRVASADLVYFSGITLAILSPDDLDTLHGVLADSRAGRLIAFDPNIRPRLWRSETHMRDTLVRFAALADVVLPGVEDESIAFGAVSAEGVADRYLDAGAERVVVKDGGRGVFVRGDVELDVALDAIEQPLDTTGAGDAFAGACLASMLDGMDVATSIQRAHACAAIVIMTPGALCPVDRLLHL